MDFQKKKRKTQQDFSTLLEGVTTLILIIPVISVLLLTLKNTLPILQKLLNYCIKQLLHKARDLTTSPSLKRLLHSKADAFLSNDYYESDIAWLELDSKLDVTIGPYETYEDALFEYRATFEAFICIRDDKATAQLKSEDVTSALIRVIQLIQLVYNSGDIKGTQPAAFNLPNDERIVKERGSSMVMLKNVSEAKFKLILRPIADVCIMEEQRELVDFDSFFTHIICHECCHGIGPHSIKLPNGQKSTVRLLQKLHSALEEAKVDIVGLWSLNFLIAKDLLPKTLVKSIYVSFLAGCFRTVRFGLGKAHGDLCFHMDTIRDISFVLNYNYSPSFFLYILWMRNFCRKMNLIFIFNCCKTKY